MEPGAKLVSIIVVNYNGRELLEACLKSVQRHSQLPVEIIVVDNGSTDGSVDVLKEGFPGARIIANSTNVGFAEGNNQGVAVACGEYVVLLNNDTIVEEGWLEPLIAGLLSPGVAVVASRVITEGVPAEFYEMNGTINYLGYNIMRVFRDVTRIFYAGGASMAFRRTAVARPFLPQYFLYHEDLFFSWWMRLQGGRVVMVPDSVVRHRGSASTQRQTPAFATFHQERNRLLTCLLLYERRTLMRLLPYFVMDACAKLLLSVVLRRKSFLGIVRAYVWLYRHRTWIRTHRTGCQAVRTTRDTEIMTHMSSDVVNARSWTGRVVNACSRGYATLAGLPYYG